jgi:HAE1 family hydrophobic/amphiphilic exporter-1
MNPQKVRHANHALNYQGNANSANSATFTIDLGDKRLRQRNMEIIIQQTRTLLSNVGGIEVKNIGPLGGGGGGALPIHIEIKGDGDKLKEIATNLSQKIAKVKSVVDLSNSYQQGNPAYSINIDRDIASNLGIDLTDFGLTIQYLFAGIAVTQWEDPRDGQNYDVYVQIPQDERNTNVLDLLKIRSQKPDENGLPRMVPLSVIAKTTNSFSPRQIDHVDLHRKVTITGNIDTKDIGAVLGKIQKIIDTYELPAGYSIIQKGIDDDMKKSFMYAVAALMVGVIFIYMILTAQFRSFILPLVIMVSLPLSFVGVFVALLLSNNTLNMFSVIGIIMLMGLASKNGILLVDFINQQLIEGATQMEAIINAGRVRLRPIIMTTTAMIFGMIPSAFGTSETNRPMAWAIIGGMITSTLLTLVIVPVVYIYMDKFSKSIQKSLKNNEVHT